MLRRDFLALIPVTLLPWKPKEPETPEFLTDEQIAQKIVDYHNNIVIGASPQYFTYSDFLPGEPSRRRPHTVERLHRVATSYSLATVTKTRNGTEITETHTFRNKGLRDDNGCSWNEWFDIKDPAVKILQFIDRLPPLYWRTSIPRIAKLSKERKDQFYARTKPNHWVKL